MASDLVESLLDYYWANQDFLLVVLALKQQVQAEDQSSLEATLVWLAQDLCLAGWAVVLCRLAPKDH